MTLQKRAAKSRLHSQTRHIRQQHFDYGYLQKNIPGSVNLIVLNDGRVIDPDTVIRRA
jgi:hypothetical protein